MNKYGDDKVTGLLGAGDYSDLLQMLGDDGLRRFLGIYLSESKRRLQDMVQGAAEGDMERVRGAAHALMPTSRWVGAEEVAVLCERLHQRRPQDRLSEDDARLVQLIAEHHQAWEQKLHQSIPDVRPAPANLRMPGLGELRMPR